MSDHLRIDPRTRHVIESIVEDVLGPGEWGVDKITDGLMSAPFEVVGVGPNGEQALCAIDPDSSVKP